MKRLLSFILIGVIGVGAINIVSNIDNSFFSVNKIHLVYAQKNETKPAKTPKIKPKQKSTSKPSSNTSVDDERSKKKEPKKEEITAPIFYSGDVYTKKQNRYDIKNVQKNLLPSVAKWLGSTIGAIAVLFLIWAGVQFLTAEGDQEKISKSAKTAFFVIAGLILMMFGYALVYLFLTIFTPSIK